MKRASYRDAIRWIAENDSAGDHNSLEEGPVSELITSVLVTDIFDVAPERVGKDVVRERKRLEAKDE